jgi:hypothetical protein
MSTASAIVPEVKRSPLRITQWTCYLIAALLLWLVCIAPTLSRGTGLNSRFGTFWASGAAAARGANPYAAYPETFLADWRNFHGAAASAELNLNPPCTLPLLQMLARAPMRRFAARWTVAAFFLMLAGVALLLWDRPQMQHRQVLWLMLNIMVFDSIVGAENYCELFLLATLGIVLARRGRGWLAAVAIGLLVALKPTVIFWPLLLLIGGHARLAWRSFIITVFVSLAPLLIYGPRVYIQWLGALRGDPHWIVPLDIALIPFFRRLGLEPLGVAAALALFLFLAVFVRRRSLDVVPVSIFGLCSMILCAPLAWTDYVLMLAPAFVMRRWGHTETIIAAAFMIPTIAMQAPASHLSTPLMSICDGGLYLVAANAILFYCVCRERSNSISTSMSVREPIAAHSASRDIAAAHLDAECVDG